MPTRAGVLAWLAENPDGDRRRIFAALGAKGPARAALKTLLRELEREGAIGAGGRRGVIAPLGSVAVVDVVAIDREQAIVVVKPTSWPADRAPPRITFVAGRVVAAPEVGDRLLVRLERDGPRRWNAHPIRRLDIAVERCVGVFETARDGGRIRPTDRRQRETLAVQAGDDGDAEAGELVLAEVLPAVGMGPRRARVVERLGAYGPNGGFSRAAIVAHAIPEMFTADALAEAALAEPVALDARTDLRMLPLVTIDGADARDFDDAVFAEPDHDRGNPGGFHLVVAIADVAQYVAAGSALDRAARERGNSVYFPDRVVPMLPEALSNGLCSLVPDQDRACLAVHVWIDAEGRKLSHRFVRGVMRSHARLTYEQAQAAIDAEDPDPAEERLRDQVLRPLYGAFTALDRARRARGALDLDLPERRVMVDPASGALLGIGMRVRRDSHRLIEEFMILANVCAAETLEARGVPTLYRVHDRPPPERLAALAEFLKPRGLSFARGQVPMARQFADLLDRVRASPDAAVIQETVLRTQAQAVYQPDNIGHFGLALRRYAHFTSPIRRYADLVVHRALIAALDLGADGLSPDIGELAAIGGEVSATERRAATAEREVVDRFVAAWFEGRRGEGFAATVSGVGGFGLFVRLAESGAEGLVPMRRLPGDYWEFDEAARRLVGARSGWAMTLGDLVTVRLSEVDVTTGSLTFDFVDGGRPVTNSGPAAGRRARGRR